MAISSALGVCWGAGVVFQQILDAGVDRLHVAQDLEEDPVETAARVAVPEHFASETKPLTGRSSKQEVYALPVYIPRPPLLHVAKLYRVGEVELRLRYGVLVYLASVVSFDRHAQLSQGYLPAAHSVKEREYR